MMIYSNHYQNDSSSIDIDNTDYDNGPVLVYIIIINHSFNIF